MQRIPISGELASDVHAHIGDQQLASQQMATAQARLDAVRAKGEVLKLRACIAVGFGNPESHSLEVSAAGVFLVERPVANPRPTDAAPAPETARAAEGGA